MRPTLKVTKDRDRGFRAMGQLAERFAAHPPIVAVGVTGQPATATHRRARRGETVVEIALKHEFGEGVPQRSFIRSTFDAGISEYRELTCKAFASTLMYAIKTRNGNWTPQTSTALKRLGLKVEGDIKKRIAAGIAPALSAYTLRRKGKGKTTPLIDTGQLRASISSVIYRRRPAP